MKLDRLAVYWIKVDVENREEKPTGGELEMNEEIIKLFESSFLGKEKISPKKQPFHFNFGGPVRNNVARDRILKLLEDPHGDIETSTEELAKELQKILDDRIGDLLLTIGLGWTTTNKRCVIWVFPSDSPIQLQSNKGKPTIKEIKQAFTRKSKYRKAIYFEGPINVTRSDFLRGELIDSTRQGKSRSVAHYWVEKFLYGHISLSASQGVMYLIRGIKNAQKVAKNSDEITSVISAYTRLLSGSMTNTTLTQFSGMLVGEAKKAYNKIIPNTIEQDAVFDIDISEVKRYVKKIVYVLSNGIIVMFPLDQSIDPEDFITVANNGRIIKIQEKIKSEYIE